jgi:hypothetical protein
MIGSLEADLLSASFGSWEIFKKTNLLRLGVKDGEVDMHCGERWSGVV